jgi:hypothetical protein
MKNNINLDLKQFPKTFGLIVKKVQKYFVFASLIIFLGLYIFLIFQISSASQNEPNQDEITLQLSTIKRLKIDQESINKIQQLQDQNIVVQSLFEAARNDPFKE